MANYTVKNLKQVENMAEQFGMSDGLEARFARGPLELSNFGLSYQRLEPNFRIPFGHKHGEQEEVYVLLSGSARLKLDDEIVELQQWDAVRVPVDELRDEGEDEDDRLRIQQVDDQPLGIEIPRSARCAALRILFHPAREQAADAEENEIGSADVPHGIERHLRREHK